MKLHAGEIPDEVMKFVLDELGKLNSGELVLISQDGFLMQIDRLQKLRISDWKSERDESNLTESQKKSIADRIRKEFSSLQFGRLVVKVTKNRIQLERTELQRFTGLDGEGI